MSSHASRWFTASFKRHNRRIPGEASGRSGLAVLALAIYALLSLKYGHNFYSVSDNLAILAGVFSICIASAGSMALLISGNVDLSIGSIFALDAIVVGEVLIHTHSTALGIAVGLLFGAFLGAVNGCLVRLLKLSPLIVTIATLTIYGGVALAITQGLSIYGFPHSFTVIGQGKLGGVSYPVMVAIVIFVIVGFLLVRTKAGLRLYAIGGDSRSAELAGIPVGRLTILLYTINGLLIGVVAILTVANIGEADPGLGLNFEFTVLTAVIIGGVAFAGGAGRPLGVFLGILLLGIIDTGVIFIGLQASGQEVVQGSLLMLALGADQVLVYWKGRQSGKKIADRLNSGSPTGATDSTKSASDDVPEEPVSDFRATRIKSTALVENRVVFEARELRKWYGPVLAVNDVSVTVRAGEVHCLVGDNGAGKSTLIKMLSGAIQSDSGAILIEGEESHFTSPKSAREAGVQTVYQDLAVCSNLSVAHNLVLGNEPTKRLGGVLPLRDDDRAREIAVTRLEALGIELDDYDVAVRNLSGGQRQSVAIAKALGPDVKVAILDEPTAALGVRQTENVLRLVRAVADRGTGVLLITHDIETVLAVGDTVTVLRLGSVVHDGAVGDMDEIALLKMMAGFQADRRQG